ncbi:response regulator transcription factor [Candidatus Pacearchaeota archaeon]|nr:response regulator transcription factor [Candidatus Pacearchaeota archaeon]
MKVLIVEDDIETIEFISIALDVGWDNISILSVSHGKNVPYIVDSESPNIIILDLGLPDISGFEVLKEIRLFSNVPIIIATVSGSEESIVKGLDFGADEYIVKPFGQLELLARIKAVLRSRNIEKEGSEPITLGPLKYYPDSAKLKYGLKYIHLTRTECLIIYELIRNAGNLVTYSKLADTIWGDYYPNAPDTLRVYIRRLRVKIETETGCSGLISSRPGLGYIMELPSSA